MSERQQILVPGTHATLALLQTVSEPDPPSISAVVRYSRVRTEEFTVVGAERRPLCFPTIFCPRFKATDELSVLSSRVSIGAVGIHGHPLPEVSRPVWFSGPVSSRALNRLRARALGDPAIGIDASLSAEIEGPVCSVSIAGPRGP